MLLCDAAESVGGKLYIIGAGWSQILVPDHPVNMSLAVKLEISWHQANDPHRVVARLLNGDGEQVMLSGQDGEDGEPIPVLNEVRVETGRPPGLAPGTNLDAPFVFNFQGLRLSAGSYVWELEVEGNVEARAAFRVGPPNRR